MSTAHKRTGLERVEYYDWSDNHPPAAWQVPDDGRYNGTTIQVVSTVTVPLRDNA